MDYRVVDTVIEMSIFLGLAGTYLLRSLMLFERADHEGPLRSSKSKRYVRFERSGHIQHVALFDWVRRLFGVYQINALGEWVVDEDRPQVQRFTCPFCLSWWTTTILSLPFTYIYFGATWVGLAWNIPIHFFIAIVSQICYRYLWD